MYRQEECHMVVSAVLIAEQIIRVRNGHGGYDEGSKWGRPG